jgi:hypothetical protein
MSNRCITIYLSDHIRWVLHHMISTMMTSLKVRLPFLFFSSIDIYYLNLFETIDCVLVLLTKIYRETFQNMCYLKKTI